MGVTGIGGYSIKENLSIYKVIKYQHPVNN